MADARMNKTMCECNRSLSPSHSARDVTTQRRVCVDFCIGKMPIMEFEGAKRVPWDARNMAFTAAIGVHDMNSTSLL